MNSGPLLETSWMASIVVMMLVFGAITAFRVSRKN